MGIMRKSVAGAAVVALLATSATPAFAGWGGGTYISGGFGSGFGYGGFGGRRRHHRHHDRVDAGDVIAGIAVIGAIAAIASSASKRKREREEGYPSRDSRRDSRSDSGRINSESAAVDACAVAAEERGGTTASVRDISQVDRTQDGWDVEGIIEERDNWKDRSGERRRFTCSVRYGEVDHVYIETDTVASR